MSKKAYRISALLSNDGETHLTLQNSETLTMECTLNDEAITSDVKATIQANPDLPQCLLDVESIYERLSGQKVPNPRRIVEFCLKHNLYLYPAVYNDLCARYCEVAYGYRCFFTSETVDSMLDAVEENMDKFPQAVDFPTTDQLLTVFMEDTDV